MELEGNMEEEEHTMAQEKDNADIDQPEDDDPEEWLDDIDALTAEECNNLAESIWPVKRMLVKVNVLYQKNKDLTVFSDDVTGFSSATRLGISEIQKAWKARKRRVSGQWLQLMRCACLLS